MHKKLYKVIFIPFILVLLFFSSFLFISCKNKNEAKLNVFNDIIDYLKLNALPEKGEYIYLFTPESELSSAGRVVSYDTSTNNLILVGNSAIFQEYVLTIPPLHDYSKNTFYTVEAKSPTLNLQTTFSLPTTPFISIYHTTSLPDFSLKKMNEQSQDITDLQKQQFRSFLSKELNTIIQEFNQFYFNVVKSGDQKYKDAVLRYFYLPIIVVENINF